MGSGPLHGSNTVCVGLDSRFMRELILFGLKSEVDASLESLNHGDSTNISPTMDEVEAEEDSFRRPKQYATTQPTTVPPPGAI